MVVQCPHCSSKYRVNTSNIPATGGRIKCPSCKESFVVYPEAEQQESMEDKTSIAAAPNLQQMMAGLNAGGRAPAPAPDEDAGATEVVSADSLPDFAKMFGGGGGGSADAAGDDGTVEMQNPMQFYGGGGGGGGVFDEDEVQATQVVSADTLAAGAGLFGGGAPQQPAPQPAPQPANPFAGMAPQQPAQPAPQPAAAPAAAPAGPDPNHGGPWKLKTSYGLTYEYPDNRNLLNWINKQEDLTGYELSADGGKTFFPLESFPQIKGGGGGAGAAAAGLPPASGGGFGGGAPAGGGFGGGAPAGGGFGGGGGGVPGPAITNTNAPKLESRDAKWKGAVYGVLALVFVLGAVVALDFTGTFKVGIFPEEKPKTNTTPPPNTTTAEQPVTTGTTGADEGNPTAEQKALAKSLVKDARHELKSNRFPAAKDKLSSALKMDPENPEIYELLAQVHEQLGEKDKAAEMKKLAAEKAKGAN